MTDPHDALSGFLRKLGHLRARATEGPPEEAAARECLWVEFSRLTRLVAPTSSHPEGLPLAASTDERSEVRFESWSFPGLDIECEWLPSDMLRVMLAPRVRGALVSVECAAQGGPFAEVASSTTSGEALSTWDRLPNGRSRRSVAPSHCVSSSRLSAGTPGRPDR